MDTSYLPVNQLSLDLENYRTVHQSNEVDAIHALIAIDTDWFWALMESLIDDGYLPTENIIVIRDGKKNIVKEGNRRVAALKLIHGHIPHKQFQLPTPLLTKLAKLDKGWKTTNQEVPCAIYKVSESDIVDKIVTLTHGKGELAGRAKWKAIARARHSRDENNSSEPALDLLEKYLSSGKNVTSDQREQWAGDFPLTVLEEAIRRIAPRIGCESARKLADLYPNIPNYKSQIDSLIHDIGVESLDFKTIRDITTDFALNYKVPPIKKSAVGSKAKEEKKKVPAKTNPAKSAKEDLVSKEDSKGRAYALQDPRSVMKAIKEFSPKGNNREKLVTLMDEMMRLKIPLHPHSFCFLLRSAFEVSAKAYSKDHTEIKMIKNNQDRPLVDVLRDITNHLTANKTDMVKLKVLHGAMTQLAKSDGILSVTSMNQLIHNPKFSIGAGDICSMFANVFPLLEEMNQ